MPALCHLLTAWLALGAPLPTAQTAASRFALAVVEDPRGKPFVDVGVDDFVVQEGGAAREILDVRVADYPIVIVLDNGAAARADFTAIRSSVSRFVERLGPRPIAIITTAGAPKIVASFEDDRPDLLAKLADVDSPNSEDGQPLRAAALAGETIRATGALFSAIILATATPIEAVGTAADAFLAPIVDSRAVMHVVINGVNSTSNPGGAAAASPLRKLAAETHGEYTAIYSPASYQPALDRIVGKLTTELLVEYIVPVGSKPTDVKIGVRIPGARVRGLGVAPK